VRRPPPLLGQHTDEVLAEIGLDAAARQHLRKIGAIGGMGAGVEASSRPSA